MLSPKSSINPSHELKNNAKQVNSGVKHHQNDKSTFSKVTHFNKGASSAKKTQQPVAEDDIYLEDLFNSDSSDCKKEVGRNQKYYLADSDIGELLKEEFTEQGCLEEKTSADNSNRKSSLLESLSRYDSENNSKPMPSTKRKISDYFSSVPK